MTNDTSQVHQTASFYDVLQVSPSASQEVIHAAYRALARGYHPDVNPTPLAGQRMLELNAAHDVLGDTERRARYDLRLARSHRRVVRAIQPAPTPAMRGRPRPESPKRVEEERAAGVLASSALAPARTRIVMVLVLLVVVTLIATGVLWLTSEFLDRVPDALIGQGATLSRSPFALGRVLDIQAGPPGLGGAQPFLNRA